jgi:MFS family permease
MVMQEKGRNVKQTPLARVVKFLGLNASVGAMIVVVIAIGLGEKMAERFLPLYLLALGGSTLSVGFLNALDNFLSAIYSFPGGYASDRLGYKKALILFTVMAMFGYLLVILVPTWWAVFIGALFFISWTAVSLPAVMSMVSRVMPAHKRAMGVSVHSFVRRIPMALGPVLGGLLIGRFGDVAGVRLGFGAAFLLGIGAIAFVLFFMADEPRTNEPVAPLRGFRNLRGPLRSLLLSDILIRFAEQIPYAFVVVWVVKNNGLSAFQFGILTTIEMVTAMLVYIPVAYLADKYGKKRFVLMTFGFFTAFPLVLLYSRTFPLLAIAFVVRGLKEFGEPTRKALIMDFAPENTKAATFGSYYLVRDVVVSLAALSSAFLWNVSPGANFLVASACGLIGTILFAIFGKDLKRRAAGVS